MPDPCTCLDAQANRETVTYSSLRGTPRRRQSEGEQTLGLLYMILDAKGGNDRVCGCGGRRSQTGGIDQSVSVGYD